ncbi:hypothetical protein QQM79_08260 [Marinobacteraceae bacterium S3BR75-40.1]
MAFKQVKDLIEWIVEYHEALERQYSRLAGCHTDERMVMALQFLASRERRQASMMEDFLQDADDSLMDAWLRDAQSFDAHNVAASVPECRGCEDIQDILRNVLQSHDTLAAMYQARSLLARSRRESELFQELAVSELAEARLQSRDIARLEIY